MSLDLSHFENPKMAIIRLLKSQCLCSNQPCNQKVEIVQKAESESIALLRYKEELQQKVALERSKLQEIPCVITLAEEIEEVKEIIAGLTRENRERIEHVRLLEKEMEVEKVQYYQNSIDEEADIIEHEKLQAEYANLMRTLEMTNDENQRLIRKLASQ